MANKKPEQPKKKEGVMSKVAHAIDAVVHPSHHAEQEQVGDILDQVSENLESDPEKALAAVKGSSAEDDEKSQAIEHHPKFSKFKKGN